MRFFDLVFLHLKILSRLAGILARSAPTSRGRVILRACSAQHQPGSYANVDEDICDDRSGDDNGSRVTDGRSLSQRYR